MMLDPRSRTRRVASAWLLALSGAGAGTALAASADLSSTPIDSTPSAAIRPNVMFVLDDSGSMDDDFVPDIADYNNLCFGDSRINRIFYDPTVTYLAPVGADGSSHADASFTSARRDGYGTGTTRDLSVLANLSTPETQIGETSGRRPEPILSRFYYARYAGTGAAACKGNSYDYTKFSIVTSAAAIGAPAGVNALTNYANWYSYYRTRMLTMRSAAGRVFANVDASRFRVGFSTIHDTSVDDGDEFLNIRDFDADTQKTTFFSRLYGNAPGGSTPLRPALVKAGRYFANKASGQSVDPVQYSCQRNYTILSTDGYWNTDDEPRNFNRRLDSTTAIGNQDGPGSGAVSPQLDDVDGRGRTGGPGVANTLADIAQYYYKTDLRSDGLDNCTGDMAGQDVCTDNVSPVAGDPATFQHMNTITLGLGVAGRLAYDPSYETQTAGDYFQIINRSRAWPDPDPSSDSNTVTERIDDLWHAAVNGRGKYYSANDPIELANSLTRALQIISATPGAGAAAATSNLKPSAGDNYVFLATYITQYWSGNITALMMNPATGAVSTTGLWDAKTQLNAQVGTASDSRDIYFYSATAPNKLAAFTYANLTTAGLNGHFDNLCPSSGTARLGQCGGLDAAEKAAATGARLVEYLRGQSGYENAGTNAVKVFRERSDGTTRNVLGDIVSSQPVYVKKPPFNYLDSGYAGFAGSNAGRRGVVYAGANDGMLHAFDADTGSELWAYVPTPVIPNLYKLADYGYANQHQYYVDGAPTAADVHDGSAWRSIVVTGLNKGGRGYFALDVTSPSAPKALWEYSDPDLGYTYGNPVIGKLRNGTWVVIFGSGYNNVSPGSGNGYLHVLNAVTGAPIAKIPTYTSGTSPAGTSATPSNLGAVNAWVDRLNDNTLQRAYAGDMLGNLWRFDLDDNVAPAGNEAFLLAQTRAASGALQPITTRPELSELKLGATRHALVSVGTGRFFGSSDVGDTTLQSVYTFKDALGTTSLGDLRGHSGMVAQTLRATTTGSGRAARGIADPRTVDWARQVGWYVDLGLSSGERVTVDMQQQLGILTVATNVPATNACSAGGSSWLYFFDIGSGSFVSTNADEVAGYFLGNTLVEGITTFEKSGGGTGTLVVDNKGGIKNEDNPPPPPLAGGARRTSWRELVH